jgi:carbonic anhydrase
LDFATEPLDNRHFIDALYAAFNGRDIDAVLARLHPNVDWPNGWEGGRIQGRAAVRDYWMRQWDEIDPSVEPVRVDVDPGGRTIVQVHQTVRTVDGSLIGRQLVQHVYTIEDGLVRRMEIMPPVPSLDRLFENNRDWARRIVERDPTFFQLLSGQQSPDYLWIGCADSRVPANEITGLLPGELFVHRNVANVVVHTDLNCLSVLQFAVDVLKVTHVIVCGHYGCGGIRAAYLKLTLGLCDNWLRHVQDVKDRHEAAIERLPDDDARMDRLCELNVVDQVRHVCETTIVQDAWRRHQPVAVHGWIYGLHDGLLRDLRCTTASAEEVVAAHTQALQSLESGQPLLPQAG